jgi:dihydroneopterin aldolase
MKILLRDLEFFSFHGVHELEKKVGTIFLLDATIEFEENKLITDLHHTIDYEVVYEVIKKEFSSTESLLEVLAEKIAQAIKIRFPFVSQIILRIIKKGAFIKGLSGHVGVELTKNYIA